MKTKLVFIITLMFVICMFSTAVMAGSSAVANAGASATGGNATGGNATATGGSIRDINAGIGGDVNASNSQIVNNNFPEPKDITTTRTEGKGFRPFVNQAEVHYPGHVSYFGQATPGSSFESVSVLLSYKTGFELDELKNMAKGGWGSKVIVNPLVKPVPEEDRSNVVTVFLGKPTNRAKPLAFITVKATNNDTTSADILAEAMLKAREYGADAIQVTAEGVERELTTFSWGVGLAYSYANISANEDRGGIGSGGTGIAGGHAGYKDRPWFRVIALKIEK